MKEQSLIKEIRESIQLFLLLLFPHSWSHTPVSTTCRPGFWIKEINASGSFVIPHWTAFTRVRSYSPRRRLMRKGVARLAFKSRCLKLWRIERQS